MEHAIIEQQVRSRAYAMWESEGRPVGRDAEHWRLSEEAVRAEAAPKAAAKKLKPKAKSASGKSAAVKRSAALADLSAAL